MTTNIKNNYISFGKQQIKHTLQNYHSTVHKKGEFHFECKKYENLQNKSHNILKHFFQMNISTKLKKKLLSDTMSLNDPVTTDLLSNQQAPLAKFFFRQR